MGHCRPRPSRHELRSFLRVRALFERCIDVHMTYYVAIVEEEEGTAVGVWFPDLPGCFSAGDTLDEAMTNAAEALELWVGAMIESGRKIPLPRTLIALTADSEFAEELARYMVALIPFPAGLAKPAAE